MRLLFDHNLSPHLVNRIADIFPNSSHVFLQGLDRATDAEVWEFARDNGFTLVTKDSDFNDLTTLRGFPPKVIWLRIGNCTTAAIERLLRQHQQAIEQLEADAGAGVLTLL